MNNFNPRTSCEVRQFTIATAPQRFAISIHAPRVRCDSPDSAEQAHFYHFNPRTSCEVRQQKYRSFLFIFAIYDMIKNFNRIIFILFHLITSTI